MMSSGTLLIALVLQIPLTAGDTIPETAATTARLEIRGSSSCVSRANVATRVAARSPRIRFVEDAPVAAHVAIVSSRPGNVVAELTLTAPGAEATPRRIVARSCGDAVDAVALIIAVTLDPTLKRKPVARSAPEGSSAGGGDKSSRSSADASGRASSTSPGGTVPRASAAPNATEPPATPDEPGPPARPDKPAPPAMVDRPMPPPAASLGSRRSFGAYVSGQVIVGPAPAILPGIAATGMATLDRAGIWAPALIVGVTRVWRSDLVQPGGAASFTLDAASIDACPLRVGVAQVATRVCASALVGRLTTSGSDTDQGTTATRPFAAAGGALTVNAGVGTIVDLYARLGIGATLIRDSYELGTTTFYRAGRLTTSASLGIGLRW